jgi:hypothetical protein
VGVPANNCHEFLLANGDVDAAFRDALMVIERNCRWPRWPAGRTGMSPRPEYDPARARPVKGG